jgi:hypothetical protein
VELLMMTMVQVSAGGMLDIKQDKTKQTTAGSFDEDHELLPYYYLTERRWDEARN